MLKNTKSIIILKKFFTLLDEKTKLDIIKYNKNMQNILDISLINYKTFSGRYILYGKNGKGKEYDYDGSLIYEGEYLNGKRNGKGKEYNYNGLLIFEGEYLNGKKWNGKVYERHKIMRELIEGKGCRDGKYFKGEYLNEERIGKGKDNFYPLFKYIKY